MSIKASLWCLLLASVFFFTPLKAKGLSSYRPYQPIAGGAVVLKATTTDKSNAKRGHSTNMREENSDRHENAETNSWWNGEHYSKHSEWQFYMANKALGYIDIPYNSNILDIGCGNGRFTHYMATLLPHAKILGLDPSLSMLDSTRTKIAPNLFFMCGDARTLPFQNQFERIVAFNSLHWIREIGTALDSIREALVPCGKVLILVAPVQVRHPLHRIIDQVAGAQRWRGYFDNASSLFFFKTLGEWAIAIEEAKMVPEKVEFVDASFSYPSVQAFADSLASWIPFGKIPEEDRPDFINEIVKSYLEHTPYSSDGSVFYYLDELIIVASKPKMS